jgi:hypothetical protein
MLGANPIARADRRARDRASPVDIAPLDPTRTNIRPCARVAAGRDLHRVLDGLRVGASEIAFKHRAIGNPHAEGKLLHMPRP